MFKIVADKNQPLVNQYFGKYAEIVELAAEEITNAALLSSGADALICRSTVKINEDLLKNTGIKFVGTCTIGYDHVDFDYLKANNIGFSSAPGCNANSVGEYIVAALLKHALAKGYTLGGKTLGIIGVGNVGKAVAVKAEALGLKLLLNDPPRARLEGESGFCGLDKLLSESDFISVHVPLIRSGIDKTLGLADEEFFSKVKRGAVFINAARGKVARTSAIIEAYRAGILEDYILDVYENEPEVLPAVLENAFIATPHIAGYSYDGKTNGTSAVFKSFSRHFALDVAIGNTDINNDYQGEIVIPDVCKGLEAIDFAVESCYAVFEDSRLLKAAPGNFRELRKNYPKRYEFSHYSVSGCGREDLEILYGLGFGRGDGR